MSELSDAWDALQAEYERATGKPARVLIDGTAYRCIPSEATYDDMVMAGANAEGGGFRVSIGAHLMAEPPERGASIIKDDQELQVYSVVSRNGVEFDVTAQDIAASEDRDG